MKVFTSSLFAGILALASMTSKRSSFASATTIFSEVGKAKLAAAPLVNVVAPSDSPIDPQVDRISMLGLDPHVPLTRAEAAFLEETIMEVFNVVHKDMGIDLFAESVSVGTNAIFNQTMDTNETMVGNSTNLRGSGRQLERVINGNPGPDTNWCHYQSGPKKGEWKPGCEFDITLYVCCRCWMCLDDDFTWGFSWRPTKKPTPKPTLSTYDQFLMGLDDDGLKDQIKNNRKPTRKPTVKPTTIVDIEKERGPQEPIFQEPIFQEPPRKPKNFDQEVMKKLKNGPFSRFHNLKKLRFGRGN